MHFTFLFENRQRIEIAIKHTDSAWQRRSDGVCEWNCARQNEKKEEAELQLTIVTALLITTQYFRFMLLKSYGKAMWGFYATLFLEKLFFSSSFSFSLSGFFNEINLFVVILCLMTNDVVTVAIHIFRFKRILMDGYWLRS